MWMKKRLIVGRFDELLNNRDKTFVQKTVRLFINIDTKN